MSTLPQRWLVVRLGAMGDALLTTGVLEHWRRTRGLRFHVLTKAPWAELYQGHPAVEQVLPVQTEQLRGIAWLRFCRELARRYRGWGLLDLHGVPRSRLLGLCWQGAVRRSPKFALERRLFRVLRSSAMQQRLEALTVPQRYSLALEPATEAPPAQSLGPLLHLAEEEEHWAAKALGAKFREKRPLVALHPLAAHPLKAWPGHYWPRLAELLHQAGWHWFLVGRGIVPPALAEFMEQAAEFGGACFINETTPRQTAALLAQAEVLVSGDSGPMHLGTAVGTPVVGLFGPTARVWGFFPHGAVRTPGGRHLVLEETLPCRPCSLHGKADCPREGACLAGISPETVLAALEKASGGAPESPV